MFELLAAGVDEESGKSWSSICVNANQELMSVALIHGTNTPQKTHDGMPITVVILSDTLDVYPEGW